MASVVERACSSPDHCSIYIDTHHQAQCLAQERVKAKKRSRKHFSRFLLMLPPSSYIIKSKRHAVVMSPPILLYTRRKHFPDESPEKEKGGLFPLKEKSCHSPFGIMFGFCPRPAVVLLNRKRHLHCVCVEFMHPLPVTVKINDERKMQTCPLLKGQRSSSESST